MTDLVFVDSNVLVYPHDRSAGDKQALARSWLRALWAAPIGRLSIQVVNESYVTITRKLKPGLSPEDAQLVLRPYANWNPVSLDTVLVEAAWHAEASFHLSWWDSLIVAAAQRAGCRWLLTEDLQDGRRFGELVVVDPFRHTPDEVLGGDEGQVSEAAPPRRRRVRTARR